MSAAGEPEDEGLWIFGYGSLVWRPAFPHRRRCRASIEGFARRFWQASTDHRGVPDQPGRVVTLVDESILPALEPDYRPAPCWGTAYEVPRDDPDDVLSGLDHRERGGYLRVTLPLRLFDEPGQGTPSRSVEGLVYIAGPENPNYVGFETPDEIAQRVAAAVGPSGPNPEYVFALADHLRAIDAADPHLVEVEAALRRFLDARGEEDEA